MSNQNIIYKQSIDLHLKNSGKIEIKSKVILDDKEALSLAYSPGVAAVCEEISKDKSKAKNLTLKANTVAVVSDGSAILGLGNLGAEAAIPVMEGKAAILKEFAGVDAFPICLKTQDTEEIINIIKNIAPVFGGINLEDISSPKCFEIEERLRKELDIPVMHDDQWGAATCVLAGLINSLKLTNKKPENIKVVLVGIGAAGVATARLLNSYGVKNILYFDSKGIINRQREDLNKEKLELLNNSNLQNENKTLEEALEGADVFIGLSKGGLLKKEMISKMNQKPIVFALANPTPEIMPEEAKEAGVYIIATGRSDYPNQINNSLFFPAFWKAMLLLQKENKYSSVDNNLFIEVAKAIADYVKDLSTDKILPNMFDKSLVDEVVKFILKN